MRPTRIFIAAALAFAAWSAPLLADDIKSALQDFGFIGTWSADCKKDISEPRAGRLVVAASSGSGATATTRDNNGTAIITTDHEITEASRIGGDKIRIALHPVKVTKSDGSAVSQHAYDNLRLVFQKAGEKIEIVRVQFEGLPEIERASFFERCPG